MGVPNSGTLSDCECALKAEAVFRLACIERVTISDVSFVDDHRKVSATSYALIRSDV
jgi:hypothetical protein